MVAESNPLFASQWHLQNIGDLQAVWADYTGAGVSVGIYDSGVDTDHPDLIANYDPSQHYSGIGSNNGTYTFGEAHGTSVAGIIAAEDNGIGGVGVAFGAQITSVNFLGYVINQSDPIYYQALRWMSHFDVVNNSWGTYGTYEDFLDIGDPGEQAALEIAAMRYAVDNGRGGLGTVIVKAAGNEAHDTTLINSYGMTGNAQGEGINNAHETITVGAVDQFGSVEYYSNWGASLLISAPSAAVTTDIAGFQGYNGTDYASDFGGTSAATPVVSGVIALMLEANDGLGWRDVQTILAMSAAQVGSTYGSFAAGWEESRWYSNAATDWNGGGMTYNLSYGFGQVDAFAAVRMAEAWTVMNGAARTSANMQVVTAEYTGGSDAIFDNDSATMAITVTDAIEIEHMYVTLDITHSYTGDLYIELSNDAVPGWTTTLFAYEGGGSFYNDDWTFGVTGALGMSSAGTWRVTVHDDYSGDIGVLKDFSVEFRGAAETVNSLYTFTDDFLELKAVDAARGTLAETDGGTDWLNLVALSGDVVVSMANGGSLAVDGAQWTTLSNGTQIENVYAGDGDDDLSANDARNLIYGARGNDTVEGLGNNDTLYAGTGDDSMDGGTGNDRMWGEAGADTLLGSLGNDLLYGGTQSDDLRGGAGNDLLYGEAGNDRLYGDGNSDVLNGADGNDLLVGGTGNDKLYGGVGVDRLFGDDGADSLLGLAGADVLQGGTGNDTMWGGSDNDKLVADTGSDSLLGEGGNDSLYGQDGHDTMDGGTGQDEMIGGTGNDLMTGGAGNDTLLGNLGYDTLVGGAGNDVMSGQLSADTFVFADGFGNDTITDFHSRNDAEKIDLSAVTAITDIADLMANHIAVTGADVLISDGAGNSILLENVKLHHLDAADFIF